MEKFNELKTMIEELETDAIKFYEKGNNAAGTRIRKVLQDLKKKAQELRVEIQEQKNKK